ncbi:tyrosine-type recombinase/integrase [Litchfieldella xinjiangensis]|uniref:tyrosine-type recombinase/integrase n=1 Tax=Litchfieldella xinjiangensis TaxID=1166948 RepID=UPI000694C8A4|nr:site-specific integrase [Halomonas xinjiangensis]
MPKIKLTPSFIKQDLRCPDGKRKVEYCDTQIPGFYVEARATATREGTYYLRYKNARGKTQHVKIAKTTEVTLAQARKKAQQLKADIVLGGDPRGELKRKKQVPTFAEFVNDRYLPYIKVRKRSWETDVSFLKNHILPVFGDSPLDEINRSQLVTFHTTLPEKNPAQRIELFNRDNTRERYLSDEEMQRLLSVLKTDNNRVVCLVILLLLSTGTRRNEALKAKWSDIDLAKRHWRIPAEIAKSKKARTVPLNDIAIQVLEEAQTYCQSQEEVFISPHTKKPLEHITAVWNRLRNKAGLRDFRLHDCRHQFASALVNGGRSLYEVQHILGHTTPKMTMRYAHLSSESLQGAASMAVGPIGKLEFRPLNRDLLSKQTDGKWTTTASASSLSKL